MVAGVARRTLRWSIEVQRLEGLLQRFELAPAEVASAQELAAEAGTAHSLLTEETFVLCEKARV
jgi:hypothetical protein